MPTPAWPSTGVTRWWCSTAAGRWPSGSRPSPVRRSTSPRPAARTRTGSATTRTRGASGRSSRSGSERFHRHRRAAGGCQRHVVVLLEDSSSVRIRACWRARKILVRAAFEHRPPTVPWRQPVARHPHSGETGSWAASVVAGPPRPSIKVRQQLPGWARYVVVVGRQEPAVRAPRAGLDTVPRPSVHMALAAGRAPHRPSQRNPRSG